MQCKVYLWVTSVCFYFILCNMYVNFLLNVLTIKKINKIQKKKKKNALAHCPIIIVSLKLFGVLV